MGTSLRLQSFGETRGFGKPRGKKIFADKDIGPIDAKMPRPAAEPDGVTNCNEAIALLQRALDPARHAIDQNIDRAGAESAEHRADGP